MKPLRSLILGAAGNRTLRKTVGNASAMQDLAARFVAGQTTADAVAATEDLAGSGLRVTCAYLGEDVHDAEAADRNAAAYMELLEQLSAAELTTSAEVSVSLAALGGNFDRMLAYKLGRRICEAAELAGTTVTLDMGDHTTTEDTLNTLGLLRSKWPSTGVTVQAYLKCTAEDCADLAEQGVRVRLCKGGYREPGTVAYTDEQEIARNYVRCANQLLESGAYPMFATHDPRLLTILAERADHHGREPGGFEFQMHYGVVPERQRSLAAEGHLVRVYVPYGEHWYDYLAQRVAERPANLAGLVAKR